MRTSQPDGHVLGGDALRPSPAIFRGRHRNLLGLLAGVETGQEFSSVAAKKKKLLLYRTRHSLVQITQQNINYKWHQKVSMALRQWPVPRRKWSLMSSIGTRMVGGDGGGGAGLQLDGFDL